MKKTMIFAAFAALVSLASCQKEEIIDNGPDNQTSPVFTASIVGSTKTTVDVTEGKVSWEEDDEITVTDAASASAVYTIESIDATTGKATFVIKSGETALGDGPYTATYGAEPATAQTYSATAGKLYMTAPETSNNSFTFTVQCGLMKLNLTKTGESVKSIAVSNSTATYTLTCDPAQSIATAKDFFIALPAGSYTKIEITNAEDVTCTLNSTNGVEVATNHIKPVTFVADKLNFSPATTGTAKAAIGGVNTDVKWVQLWKDGPKFAEYNVGTTSENKYGAYFAWAENIASTEWGDNWRMPTADEYQALLDNCTFSSEERNGVKGYVVTGKKGTAYALNSVFFPAGSGAGFGGLNDSGWYWSSSSISSERAWLLSFTISQSDRLVDGDWCTNRYNVRAVLNEAPAVPDGALPGVFSVSATKKVHFSQGNLWYGKVGDAQTATFNFEANQYDTTPASDNSWSADHISHFFWSKTASVAYAEGYNDGSASDSDVFFTNETETTSKNDFTVNVGGTEQTGWRTLSTAEWQYLFNDRTDAASKVGYATVGGVNGIIILPDSFTDPKKNNNGSGAFVPKSFTVWDQNVYTSGDNWNAMETAGAVFLPAASDRNGSNVFGVGDKGYYWSSTPSYSNFAYFVSFNSDEVGPDSNDYRGIGYSVRLVTESK